MTKEEKIFIEFKEYIDKQRQLAPEVFIARQFETPLLKAIRAGIKRHIKPLLADLIKAGEEEEEDEAKQRTLEYLLKPTTEKQPQPKDAEYLKQAKESMQGLFDLVDKDLEIERDNLLKLIRFVNKYEKDEDNYTWGILVNPAGAVFSVKKILKKIDGTITKKDLDKEGHVIPIFGGEGRRETQTYNSVEELDESEPTEIVSLHFEDNRGFVYYYFAELYGFLIIDKFKRIEQDNKELKEKLEALQTKERLHRQSRSQLKTTAGLVGRDTEQPGLFTLPAYNDDIDPLKETMSKQASITGFYLAGLWQARKDENNKLIIDNLSEIARTLKTTPQELKVYLLCLGGYQYPVISSKKNNKGNTIISIYHDKLFNIKFNIRLEPGENFDDITNDLRVGTRYLYFVRDRHIDSVEIEPSQTVQREIAGEKGTLGNVLVADTFVAFSLGLSNIMAYKLFTFTASNNPDFKISFDKLISPRHLNLEKRVYGVKTPAGKRLKAGSGKPKVLQDLKNAFDELKSRGHITDWKYDEVIDQFSWNSSNTIVKHKKLVAPKEGTGETRHGKR